MITFSSNEIDAFNKPQLASVRGLDEYTHACALRLVRLSTIARVWHNRSILLVISAILSVTSAVAHEGHRPLPTRGMEVNAETGSMLLTKAARETLDVETIEVTTQPISQSIHAYGSLVAPWTQHAVIASSLSGRIVSLNVQAGESVRAGQLLAEMDSPDLEQLQLELKTGQVESLLAAKLVALSAESSRSGAIPGMRLVEARSRQDQSVAAVELASAKWRGLRLPTTMLDAILKNPQLDYRQNLQLRSPIDGIVTHADLSLGKVVDPKEHLFEILDLSTVWLKIGVLEKDLSRVAIGQPIKLALTAMPDQQVSGAIDVVDSFLNPDTHLGTVWATLKNSFDGKPQLYPGMSGSVQIQLQQGESIVVPHDAVIRDGAERFVLVEQEQSKAASTYQKQTLVLGKRSGEFIEVLGGELFPGDRVVTRGSHELGSFFAKGVLTISKVTARDIGLKLESASFQAVAHTIAIDGVIDVSPTHRSIAAAQLGGTIDKILVDRGQKVQRGDVLALVASQAFQDLQLELLKANLNIRLNQTTVDNLRLAKDAIAQRQLWESESQLSQFNSRRDVLIQKLRTVGLDDAHMNELAERKELIRSLPVRAPIDGVIVGFEKFLGHVVRPDEPLFEVHDLSHARVEGFISERDLPSIHVGQQVRVRLVTAPEEMLNGTIVGSGQSISDLDRTLSVWIDLKDIPSYQIQHNMLARISIETGASTSVLAVANKAVIHEGTRSYLFVKGADNIFERRFVVTGLADDRRVEIREGLTQGEAIATSGAAALQSGYAALK